MTKSAIINSNSEQETIEMGETLGALLTAGDIISMIGDLGTGKTRMAKGIVSRALKVSVDEIISPSFTIVNRYEGPLTIDHADLYRVGPDAIEELGLMDLLDSECSLLIEWASEDSPILTSELRITFDWGDSDNSRILTFEYLGCGTWNSRFEKFMEDTAALGTVFA
ncbi:MAG: tRNA (adenosine(37)-N6)-threonylcarbamoyltransferase complex ATPase subunit type 1 TsaE [Desulfomonilaceae bacterium]